MDFNKAIFATTILTMMFITPSIAQSPPSPFLAPTPAPAPAPAPHHVNLTDLLSVAGPFHTFLSYLLQTQVINTFQNQANNTDQGITIFVPRDSAFAALKQSTFANLTQDQLKSLLLYHAFPKYYSLAEFKNLSSLNPVSTFAGGQYSLNLTDNMGLIRVQSQWSNPKITSSVFSTAPVAVYEVDKVLLPMQIFSTDPPLAPAPAPAPETKPSDLSPTSGNGSAPKSTQSSSPTSSSCKTHAGFASYLFFAVSGGLMLSL
ncbi:fasciclin-like arabinogalactan protein 7 [Ananas comosus]|uniref:Fasciclin-like arabinogalactan protein 7 n=1 Tax=Ananas comosus TaxID=4615 RepID=A0A6P5EQF8_ANACO|nr:fasciclin-like arabinogalactan protein 7 [Ananas comosus]